MTPKSQRRARLYQAAHRGSKHSYKTELENLQLLLCWEAGLLSEGQIARALDTDRVTVRMMRDGAIAVGMQIAESLLPQPEVAR